MIKVTLILIDLLFVSTFAKPSCKYWASNTQKSCFGNIPGNFLAAFLIAMNPSIVSAGTDSDVRTLVREGIESFQVGEVRQSLQFFDQAIQLRPNIAPYLWQRGLSLYYNSEYSECARQFQADLVVNPNGYEETTWATICLNGERKTRPQANDDMILSNIKGPIKDSRLIMSTINDVFSGRESPEKLLSSVSHSQRDDQYFYSRLYMGLFYEARGIDGDLDKSLVCIQDALKSNYAAVNSRDYMVSVARVELDRLQQHQSADL